VENHPADSRVDIDDSGKVQCLTSRMGTGGGNVPMVMETVALEGNGQRPSHRGDGYAVTDKSYTLNSTEVHGVAYPALTASKESFFMRTNEELASTLVATDYKEPQLVCHEDNPIAIDRAFFNQGKNALYEPQTYEDGTVPTLVAKGPGAVAVRYIVRRLTPTECARLQGFADRYGDIEPKSKLSDSEYHFWLDVRKTYDAINGRADKDYTKKQILTWYNKLQTDSAEYKMWGNGIALPTALYVIQGIADATKGAKND
jgi:DNA (cytosine-5)-methyltransferase 1